MPKQINLEQDTQEWHEFRRTGIGASEAPILMGVSPWKTPYQLWQEKVGLKELSTPTSKMLYGKEKENEAREWLNENTGYEFLPAVFRSVLSPWIFASLDGWCEITGQICEIKWPNDFDHNLALDGKVPEKYYPQVQHQMYVMDVQTCLYNSNNESFGDKKHISFRVYRDDSYIEDMLVKEKEFKKCMDNFEPPPLGDRDYKENYSEEWVSISQKYMNVISQIKNLEGTADFLKSELESLSNGQNTRGGGVRLSHYIRKGNIDYAKIPELKEIDLDKHRKPPISIVKISPEKIV